MSVAQTEAQRSCKAKYSRRYDRKIKYLDFMENGQRSRGAGFVKLEQRDGRSNIVLQISGLYRKDRLKRSLFLLTEEGEKELCKIELSEGGLKTCLENLDSCNLGGSGVDYEEVIGLRIPISEGKEILSAWGRETYGNSGLPANTEAGDSKVSSPRPENTEAGTLKAPSPQPANTEAGTLKAPSPRPTNTEADDLKQTPPQSAKSEQVSSKAANSGQITPALAEEKHTVIPMKDNKWAQLSAIYPHVWPFRDEREYLTIGPQDFVLFPSRYFGLVNNSFLLHGFYNYKHLILTRMEQRGKVQFYIGVPGNFYEREKQAAILFGFRSFECAADTASEGDFGYYMIPVEI